MAEAPAGVEEVAAGVTQDALGEAFGRPHRRVRGGAVNLEVATEPCRYGRCRHDHGFDPMDSRNPGYVPEPDEVLRGWTAQHVPLDRRAVESVLKYCILCWEAATDLVLHDCAVLAVLDAA